MAKVPYFRPPGSGPLHPVEANALSQLAKSNGARKTTTTVTNQVAAPVSTPTPAGVSVTLPLRLVAGSITLASADSGNPGYLLASDWTTFNAKEPALGSPATDGFALVSTTAGVRTWVRASTQAHAFVAKTGTYTATAADEVLTGDATGGAFSITLPTAVGIAGRAYTVKRINSGANAVTVATTSAQTIDGAATVALSAQWQVLRVISDGANWLVI